MIPLLTFKPETIKAVLFAIVMIGIGVLVGILSWRVTSLTKERDTALITIGVQKKSLDQVTQANLELQASLKDIVDKQRSDEETRLRIEEQVKQVNQAIQSQRQELRKLGESNATVRSYLDTPVPPELRSLYNKSNAAATTSGAIQNLVPASSTEASGPAARAKDQAAQQKR